MFDRRKTVPFARRVRPDVLLPPVGIGLQFLVSTFSRLRELTADRGAVAITGDPTALATALRKIDDHYERVPRTDLRRAIDPSLSILSGRSRTFDAAWKVRLFPTHPPMSAPIARLRTDLRAR